MTDISPKKLESNRRNAQKSTGPRSAEGKSRARFNALKHGVTAQIPVLPGEDPALFFGRVDAYKAELQPRCLRESEMIERMALMSWQSDRAARVDVARLAIRVQTAAIEAAQRAEQEADALGERLFYDRGGALPNQIKRDYDDDLPWTSWSGIAADPDSPTRLVKQLEYTGAGCRWFLDRWAQLRARIEAGQCWQSPEKLKAIRLLGRQPLDAADVREVTEVYLACHALRPDHKHAFFELRCEMTAEEFQSYEKRLAARDLDAFRPPDAPAARTMLLGLVDRVTGRLRMLVETHRIQDDKLAVWRTQAAAFDDSAEGERLRRHATACDRSLRRTFADFLKCRKDGTTPEFDILEPLDAAPLPVIAANDQDPQDGPTGDDAQQHLQNGPTTEVRDRQNEPMHSCEEDVVIDDLVDGIFRDIGIDPIDDDFQDFQNEPTDDQVQNLQNEPTDAEQALQNEPTAVSAALNLLTHSTATVPGHRSDDKHAFPPPSALRPPPLTPSSVLRPPPLAKAGYHASDGKHRRNRKARNKQTGRSERHSINRLTPGESQPPNPSATLGVSPTQRNG